MKKFPENPENYNPVQLLHQMTPGIKFTEITVSPNNPSIFQVRCEVNGLSFVGEGNNLFYYSHNKNSFKIIFKRTVYQYVSMTYPPNFRPQLKITSFPCLEL